MLFLKYFFQYALIQYDFIQYDFFYFIEKLPCRYIKKVFNNFTEVEISI